MAADKIYRVLSMYKHLQEGGVITKEDAAERYDVNERSILRDVADIREFMEKQSLRWGSTGSVIYDRKLGGYRMSRSTFSGLAGGEALAVSKALIRSGAYTKLETEALVMRLIGCCAGDENRAVLSDLLVADLENSVYASGPSGSHERLWSLCEAIHNRLIAEVTVENKVMKVKPAGIELSDGLRLTVYSENGSVTPLCRLGDIEDCTVLEKHFHIY